MRYEVIHEDRNGVSSLVFTPESKREDEVIVVLLEEEKLQNGELSVEFNEMKYTQEEVQKIVVEFIEKLFGDSEGSEYTCTEE